jgi:hypothetical protein
LLFYNYCTGINRYEETGELENKNSRTASCACPGEAENHGSTASNPNKDFLYFKISAFVVTFASIASGQNSNNRVKRKYFSTNSEKVPMNKRSRGEMGSKIQPKSQMICQRSSVWNGKLVENRKQFIGWQYRLQDFERALTRQTLREGIRKNFHAVYLSIMTRKIWNVLLSFMLLFLHNPPPT